jgi:hypothetical protein
MALQGGGPALNGDSPPTPAVVCAISFIRTVTVGSGISPDLLTLHQPKPVQALAGCCHGGAFAIAANTRRPTDTAGGEFHPALRTLSALVHLSKKQCTWARPPDFKGQRHRPQPRR